MFWRPNPNKHLLLAAFGDPNEALSNWNEYKQETPLLQRPDSLASICGHIYRNLQRGGVEDQYLKAMSKINLLRSSARIAKAMETLEFVGDRFDILPLKGFAILNHSGNYSSRSIGDIDVYVDFFNLSELLDLMQDIGFVPAHNVGLDELRNHIVPKRGSWSLVRDGVDIDLHWRIFDHLSTSENEHLVRAFYRDTRGRNMKSLELVLVHALFHDCRQTHDVYQGFHDTLSLRESINQGTLSRIASATKLNSHLLEFNKIALEFLNIDLFPELEPKKASPYDELLNVQLPRTVGNLAPRARSRIGVRTEMRRANKEVFAHRFLYWVWDLFLRSALLERLLLAKLDSFTRVPQNTASSYLEGENSSTTKQLGVGWSWRNPGWRGRYSEGPDARLILSQNSLINNLGVLKLYIEIDHIMWENSTSSDVDVFASGYFLGTIKHGESSLYFDLPSKLNPRETIEISFRPRYFYRTKSLGEGTHWYRLALPLIFAKLIRTHT